MTRRVLWPFVAVLIAATIGAGLAVGGNGESNKKMFEYAIGLWGDLPYSDVHAKVGVPNLIADMNGAQLAFSVHDGDLKAGNGTPGSTTPTTCSDAPYEQGLGYFNTLEGAAMFTPGDNDWTDCDRASNGGYNSRERLDHERQVFFSTRYSLGIHPFLQEVQTAPSCLGVSRPDCLRRESSLDVEGRDLCDGERAGLV
jgi:hypothetical protein